MVGELEVEARGRSVPQHRRVLHRLRHVPAGGRRRRHDGHEEDMAVRIVDEVQGIGGFFLYTIKKDGPFLQATKKFGLT